MNIEIVKLFSTFIILCLAQVLVLNHINLFGCATPFLYVYFILMFRRNYPKWGILLWSFTTGLCVDIFSNTPGVSAASATLLGMIQPKILGLFTPRDAAEDMMPSIKSTGAAKYIYYSTVCTVIYTAVFFSLETFNFHDPVNRLCSIGGSSLLTLILVWTIESVKKR